MILKIEGTDREIAALIEAFAELVIYPPEPVDLEQKFAEHTEQIGLLRDKVVGLLKREAEQDGEKNKPGLKLKEPAKKKPGKPKLYLSHKAPKKTPKPPKHISAGGGSKVSMEKLLKVDLNDCADIPAVINKLQLKTNITGTHLAELLGIHASDLSKARKGVIPPFVERAFKQHLQFPAVADSLNLNP